MWCFLRFAISQFTHSFGVILLFSISVSLHKIALRVSSLNSDDSCTSRTICMGSINFPLLFLHPLPMSPICDSISYRINSLILISADTLDLGKLEAGKAPMDRKEFDHSAMLLSVFKFYEVSHFMLSVEDLMGPCA